MAAPGEAPTPTPPDPSAVRIAEPPDPDRIPLPPPAVVPPSPAAPRRRWSMLDGILAAVALGFALLVASAPARNSDLWLHLATGRDLLTGKAPFGHDPYSQGGQQLYWVNTNWLYDVLTYLLFQAGGGPDGLGGAALVLFKALLVTGLAAVLIRLGWCGRGLWAPAVGAAWAVLVLSPWLTPHPMIVSYLFLGLTLYFLERPHRLADDSGGAGPISFGAYWPLLPLFVLWVNLDSWFLLGPLTVALYLLGQLMQSLFGPGRADDRLVRPGEAQALGVALAAGLAACLLNPFHVYAFVTPPVQLGLSPAAHVSAQDPDFKGLVPSLFQAAYLRPGGAGFPLALVGGLSFLLNFSRWRWRSFLVFATLFLLSAFQVRAMPFFAISAGPVLALNVQESLARQKSPWFRGAEARRWAAAGRAATLLGGLALLVVGWPGWLHAAPYEPPRWAVTADLGLRRAAEQVAQWKKSGALGPDDIGFNLSADAANYFAWFCPDEKGIVDARQTLFPPAEAADFVAVRRAMSDPGESMPPAEAQAVFAAEVLAPENGADPSRFGGAPLDEIRAVLRRRRADHLIVYDNDRSTAFAWVQRLQSYPAEWPLLYLGGHAAVFGWRDPQAKGETTSPHVDPIDLNRMAFDPPDDWKAPRDGPDREPTPADWTDAFLRSRAPRTALADEAELYLRRFDQEAAGPYPYRTVSAWYRSLAAGVVSAASCANGSVTAPATMALPWNVLTGPQGLAKDVKPTPADSFIFACRSDFEARQDAGPVGLLYLALRTARRALQADADDARAYLVLGEAYRRLLAGTAERVGYPARAFWNKAVAEVPLPYRVRTAQAIAAYTRALRLNPNLLEAHTGLITLYQDLNYQDAVLREMREVLRCNREAGARPGEDPKLFADRIHDWEDLVASREKEVKGRRDQFEVEAAGKSVFGRAEMARRKFGLADQALSILLASDVANFGREGEVLELELLLRLGRLHDVRDWVKPEAREFLGDTPYLEAVVQLEAASGDYRLADADLSDMIEVLHAAQGPADKAIPPRTALAMGVGNALLQSLTVDGALVYTAHTGLNFPKIIDIARAMTGLIVQEANVTALRGALALESGEVKQAEQDFHDALSVWGDDARAASGAGLDFDARFLAEAGKNALKKAGYLTPKLWEQ